MGLELLRLGRCRPLIPAELFQLRDGRALIAQIARVLAADIDRRELGDEGQILRDRVRLPQQHAVRATIGE
jgi:hypothetical protein